MKSRNKKILVIVTVFVLVIAAIAITQFIILTKAHSTFDNYYAFRGCVQLIQKTDTYGICKVASGATITIVEINGKWYLQGDGPGIW